MNGRTTATLQGVFSNDYHCYSSSPGVQVDTIALYWALQKQWQDVSQLMIDKGESIFYCHLCNFYGSFCMPFLRHL